MKIAVSFTSFEEKQCIQMIKISLQVYHAVMLLHIDSGSDENDGDGDGDVGVGRMMIWMIMWL